MSALAGMGGADTLPADFGSGPRVLLVLDGLGWEQLREYRSLLPVLSGLSGGPITTVAPSTTAAALTSITTSLPPGEHGIVGYRMAVDDDVLNCLRWGTDTRHDARATIPPSSLQPYDPFLGKDLAFVTKSEFRRSGFTEAHLRGGRMYGYRTPAVLVHEVARLVEQGEPAIYAYYDGVDKVAHEYGIGSEYRAELAFADRMVGDLLAAVPDGTTVIVTADHGHIDCRDGLVAIDPDVLAVTEQLSGEGRFRWLHGKPGRTAELLDLASAAHGHHAWVVDRETMITDRWFGARVSEEVELRLGDVALLPFEPIAFEDPADQGPYSLVGRHGSLTGAEMYVPCVSATT